MTRFEERLARKHAVVRRMAELDDWATAKEIGFPTATLEALNYANGWVEVQWRNQNPDGQIRYRLTARGRSIAEGKP